MHTQPWRLFALAFIVIIATFWFQTSIDIVAVLVDKIKPNERHFEEMKQLLSLLNIVVGAFSGALIGSAVTNRAMLLNSKRLKKLRERRERLKHKRVEAEALKTELANPALSFTREEFYKKHELRSLLLSEYIDEIQDIEDEEASLSLPNGNDHV